MTIKWFDLPLSLVVVLLVFSGCGVSFLGCIVANSSYNCNDRGPPPPPPPPKKLGWKVSTIAGSLGSTSSVDGIGSSAKFTAPHKIAIDGQDNLYVIDDKKIRMITNHKGSWGVDTIRQVSDHTGITVDSQNNLYISYLYPPPSLSKPGGSKIVKLTHDGTKWISNTILTKDNRAIYSITIDSQTNLYVVDRNLNSIWRAITNTGKKWGRKKIAGDHRANDPSVPNYKAFRGTNDGIGDSARFYAPSGITVDGQRNLYVTDTFNHLIRKITPLNNRTDWKVSTIAGNTNSGYKDGVGSEAQFNNPFGITIDGQGTLYVTDLLNHLIRKITPLKNGTDWKVSTIAGNTNSGYKDGVGGEAQFYKPSGITIDGQGNLYVADTLNHLMRKITPTMIPVTE